MKIPLGLMSMIYADIKGCVTLSNEDTEALVRCLEISIAQYLNTRQQSTPDATIPGRTQFTEFCNKLGFDAAERHGAVNTYNYISDWINERNKVEIEDKNTVVVTTQSHDVRYRCLLCGRDKFTRKSPHNCRHVFQKHHLKWEVLPQPEKP